MKALVIGLGSMGQRRIRCLKSLNVNDIYGFDINKRRVQEAKSLYAVNEFQSITEELKVFDMLIISTPPDKHLEYIKLAIDSKVPCFVEASVLYSDVHEIVKLNPRSLIAPSCTMHFHPMIQLINTFVNSKEFGEVTNFSYHSGQYLPDWHPWEKITDFYVSQRQTGGAREIVPFELTWITKVFGFPSEIKGFFAKTLDLGVNIDTTYSFVMNFGGYLGSMTVDVVSRFATRQFIVNFENAQLTWNWDDGFLSIYDPQKNVKIKHQQNRGKSMSGYNKNIIEEMYIDEIKTFIEAIDDPSKFPNNLDEDLRVLNLLSLIEKSDGGFKSEL